MGGLIAAWLTGEGIIIYRSVKNQKAPPGPGQLLIASGVFVMLALLAEAPKLKPLATTLAWGFDIAAFMNLFGTGAPKATAGSSWPPGQAPSTVVFPGTSSGSDAGTDLGPGTITNEGKGGSAVTSRENAAIVAGNARVGL